MNVPRIQGHGIHLNFLILYGQCFFSANCTPSIPWYINMQHRHNSSLIAEVKFLFYAIGLFCRQAFASGETEDAYLSKCKCKILDPCKQW